MCKRVSPDDLYYDSDSGTFKTHDSNDNYDQDGNKVDDRDD